MRHVLADKRAKRLAALVFNRGAAQGLVFLSTIVAAKHIAPSEFGQAGLFTSLCSFLAMASSLRFEIRALVARTPGERNRLFGLAYFSNTLFLGVAGILVAVLTAAGLVASWAWFIPAGMVLVSFVQYVFPAQHSKIEQVSRLGWMTQLVAVVTASSQILSALYRPTATALIVGRLVAWMLGAIFMARAILDGVRGARRLTVSRTLLLLKASKREIAYGVPAAVVSVLTLQVPVYVYAFHSMPAAIGIYWLAFNLLFMPYLIVSSSIRPIFLRSISRSPDTSLLAHKLRKLTAVALTVGVAASVLATFACFLLARFFLPQQWQDAPVYAAMLSLLLTSLVAQTPISFAIPLVQLQRFNFVGGILQVLARAIAMLLVLRITGNAVHAIAAFSVISAAGYVVYIFLFFRFLRIPQR